MVDRLHNLRSLPADKFEKIKRQIEETEQKYMPIFESVVGPQKEYAKMLVDKIKQQLSILKARQNAK
jgi:(p)ppGpp synthase/HD superfamily hydrolase